jgi:hypothetical protein
MANITTDVSGDTIVTDCSKIPGYCGQGYEWGWYMEECQCYQPLYALSEPVKTYEDCEHLMSIVPSGKFCKPPHGDCETCNSFTQQSGLNTPVVSDRVVGHKSKLPPQQRTASKSQQRTAPKRQQGGSVGQQPCPSGKSLSADGSCIDG